MSPLHCGETSLKFFAFFIAKPARSLHDRKDAHLVDGQDMKRGGFAPRLVSNLSRSTSYAVPKSAVQPLSKLAQHLVAWEPEKGGLKRALIHTLPHLVAVLMGALVFTYLGAL